MKYESNWGSGTMTGHKQFEQFVERTYGETFQLLEEALEYNSDGLKQDVEIGRASCRERV